MIKPILNKSKCCHICKNEFNENDKRVRDHDHKTRCYRGAAHDRCNIDEQAPPRDLPHYEGDHWHSIIKQAYEINKDIGNKWIDAIPKSFWKVYDLINWWSQIPGLLRTHGVITCEACRTHLRAERQFQELYCYIINISRTHWTAMKNKLLPVRLATWHQEVGPHKTATNK